MEDKILIINNDSSKITDIENSLAKDGFLVKTLENKKDAISQIKSFSPEFVFLSFSGQNEDSIEIINHEITEASSLLKSHHFTPEEQSLEKELYRAFGKKEFLLYYQPVISLKNDNLYGFESLIRWQHPERGLVSPDDFIPVAERSKIIVPMGFWIVEAATEQLAQWEKDFNLNKSLHLNVNLSPKQFVSKELFKRVSNILKSNSVLPENIVLEITETAFMENMESANLTLLEFKAMNHHVYMDDFGTGYSSLSYLQHFPVDTLKIDKSFVEWMHIDEQSEMIVKSIIDLAHNLGMKVVAEGVETEEHLVQLKKLGCDFGQGYYFAKPLHPDDAEAYISKFYDKN